MAPSALEADGLQGFWLQPFFFVAKLFAAVALRRLSFAQCSLDFGLLVAQSVDLESCINIGSVF